MALGFIWKIAGPMASGDTLVGEGMVVRGGVVRRGCGHFKSQNLNLETTGAYSQEKSGH
jgi:hypothetical protein